MVVSKGKPKGMKVSSQGHRGGREVIRLTKVVITCFLNRKAKAYPQGVALNTNGTILWSYILPIGAWDVDSKGQDVVCIRPSEAWYTRTTLRHRGMLKDMATSKRIPLMLN